MRHLLVGLFALSILTVTASAQNKPYAKPQIPSAAGKLAPDFTLRDQAGNQFKLSDHHGKWVLLYFYRGYWWPYCMTQLREFARRSSEFDKLDIEVVALSIDGQEHARKVWLEAAQRKFTILSDPGAKVIRQYGLLHEDGHGGEDIAIRTTLLIDPKGREVWRRVSESVPDIPTADDILQRIKQVQEHSGGVDQGH